MNDAWSIMDIVILVCGVYALYAAYVLKTKGKIIKTFLVFKETDVNTCKDLGAYAASMAPKLSTLAGDVILYGSGFFDQYLCGQHYEPLLGYDGGVDRNPDLVWNSDQKCN